MSDWHELHAAEPQAVVDPRRRLRVCAFGFAAMLAVVLGRAAQLEWRHGDAFREEANRPLMRRASLPGVRGRILARDGVVLAGDHKVFALAVHYRYLEEPCNRAWLRRTARGRLTASERRNAGRVADEENRVLAERRNLAQRLMTLGSLTPGQWESRTRQIQARVERIAENVNRRRQETAQQQRRDADEAVAADPSFWSRIGSRLLEALNSSIDEPTPRIIVAEETDYHVLAEDVPLAVVAEVEKNPDLYRGLKIVERSRRSYPAGALAAHVLGHLGPVEKEELSGNGKGGTHLPDPPDKSADDLVGRAGLERQYESLLFGHRGEAVELTDHGGRITSTYREREPGVGRDLVLTLDSRLQAAAETLLDQAIQRRTVTQPDAPPAGGAVVVLDVHDGAILAAASAPRFKPGLFAGGGSAELAALLADPAHPLFDRVAGMAIAPGSVFKVATSIALLESNTIQADTPLACRGYLDSPDQWRCAVYTRHGHGHGEVDLAGALAQSCNVYFFHHSRRMGPTPLIAWASHLGFGRPTGVDLPSEAGGTLPLPSGKGSGKGGKGVGSHLLERPDQPSVGARRLAQMVPDPFSAGWSTADTLATCIGQGTLTATPLQVARMMAAVANGGLLVEPHLVSGLGLRDRGGKDVDSPDDPIHVASPKAIEGLQPSTLAAVREGLRRVVEDPSGTGYGTIRLETVAVAGKTGTAQTGAGRPDHAWFAGYVPADEPRWALVVVLEHAGDGATAAGPVARRLVQQMEQLGLVR
jgi:penicillin-binding protein 2